MRYFSDKELGPSDKSANEMAKILYASELIAIFPTPPENAFDRVCTVLDKFLNENPRLYFDNAIQDPTFKNALDEYFTSLLREKEKKESKQAQEKINFGAQQKTIESRLARFRQLDEQSKQKAKRNSVIAILNDDGYLPANEPFYPDDLEIALRGYKGTHGAVNVVSDFDLYSEGSADIGRFKKIIDSEIKAARDSKEERRILAPINNGTHHFVFLDITIRPETNAIDVLLRDSKPEPREDSGETHVLNNAKIVSNIRRIAGNPPGKDRFEYTGDDKSQDIVQYTGQQGDNANCPFYAMREVVRVCHSDYRSEFKGLGENGLSTAESKEIKDMQIAMVQKVAKAKGIDLGKLEVDELEILHTVPSSVAYLKHKEQREKYLKERPLPLEEKETPGRPDEDSMVGGGSTASSVSIQEQEDTLETLQEKFASNINGLAEAKVQEHPEEKKILAELVKVLRTQQAFLFNDFNPTAQKNAYNSCLRVITKAKDNLDHMDPSGWRYLANILGILCFGIPALISKIVTGKWRIYTEKSAVNVDPEIDALNGVLGEIEKKVNGPQLRSS